MAEKIITRVIVRLDGSIANAVFTDKQLADFREYLEELVEASEGFPYRDVMFAALEDGEFLAHAMADLHLDDITAQALTEELYSILEKEDKENDERINATPDFNIEGLPKKADSMAADFLERLPALGSLAAIIAEKDPETGRAIDAEVKVIAEALKRMRKAAQLSDYY